jgi:hypothetical protein
MTPEPGCARTVRNFMGRSRPALSGRLGEERPEHQAGTDDEEADGQERDVDPEEHRRHPE